LLSSITTAIVSAHAFIASCNIQTGDSRKGQECVCEC
jgi:hypothetical protein